MLPCLRDLEAVKTYVAAQAIGNAGDQDDEDDINRVINEENNSGNEIPQEEENIHNHGGDVNSNPTPPHSPRNSRGSSKSVKLEEQSYQIRRQKNK